VIISDELNHASIIDGVRLCKAQRLRYRNADLHDLEARLKEAAGARRRLIADRTASFSMDGVIAPLAGICDLAERYDALVMVDDSHSVGVLGDSGRGTHEHCGVMGRVDILTGTFGKALAARVAATRRPQGDRGDAAPALAALPVLELAGAMIAAAAMQAITLLSDSHDLVDRLRANTAFFRSGITRLGFEVTGADHPSCRSCWATPGSRRRWRRRCWTTASYVVGFFIPRGAHGQGPHSASRYRQPTLVKTWSSRSAAFERRPA